jgi:hypothetical protein
MVKGVGSGQSYQYQPCKESAGHRPLDAYDQMTPKQAQQMIREIHAHKAEFQKIHDDFQKDWNDYKQKSSNRAKAESPHGTDDCRRSTSVRPQAKAKITPLRPQPHVETAPLKPQARIESVPLSHSESSGAPRKQPYENPLSGVFHGSGHIIEGVTGGVNAGSEYGGKLVGQGFKEIVSPVLGDKVGNFAESIPVTVFNTAGGIVDITGDFVGGTLGRIGDLVQW